MENDLLKKRLAHFRFWIPFFVTLFLFFSLFILLFQLIYEVIALIFPNSRSEDASLYRYGTYAYPVIFSVLILFLLRKELFKKLYVLKVIDNISSADEMLDSEELNYKVINCRDLSNLKMYIGEISIEISEKDFHKVFIFPRFFGYKLVYIEEKNEKSNIMFLDKYENVLIINIINEKNQKKVC